MQLPLLRVKNIKLILFISFAIFLIFIAIASTFKMPFFLDDYLHSSFALGSSDLLSKGLLSNAKPGTSGFINFIFNFFEIIPKYRVETLKDYGILPWWTSNNLNITPLNPLTAFTYWIDYKLWPNNIFLMHLQSAFWFCMLLSIIFILYKKLLFDKKVMLFAVILFAINSNNLITLGWIANRDAILSVVFGLIAFLFFIKNYYVNYELKYSYANDNANNNDQIEAKAKDRKAISKNEIEDKDKDKDKDKGKNKDKDKLKYIYKSKTCYRFILSIFFFLLSLLSSELGLTTILWLIAYVYIYEQNKKIKNFVKLLPFVFIALLWILIRHFANFSRVDTGLYFDIQNFITGPANVITAFLFKYPITYLNVFLGINELSSFNPLFLKKVLIPVSLLLIIFIVLLLKKDYKKEKNIRFFMLVSALSIIPISFISHLNGRVVIFVNVAALLLLSQILINNKSKITKTIFGYFLLFLPCCVICLSFFVNSQQFEDNLGMYASLEKLFTLQALNKNVIIVNNPDPFSFYYYPYRSNKRGIKLVNAIYYLVPAFSEMMIRKENNNKLVLTSKDGFLISPNSNFSGANKMPIVSEVYNYKILASIFCSNLTTFYSGQTFVLDNFVVTINKLNKTGDPTEIIINFTDEKIDENYNWQYWDWNTNRFISFNLPKSNEIKKIFGPQK